MIYHGLNEASKTLLVVMPLALNGPYSQLLAVSELDLDGLIQAIQHLTNISLLQIRGGSMSDGMIFIA